MSTVKDSVLSPAGIVALPAGADVAAEADVAGADVAGADELDELDELDDEHPAAARARTAATATQPSRGKRLPPSLVLPTRITYPFRQNVSEYATGRPHVSLLDGEDRSLDIRYRGPEVLRSPASRPQPDRLSA